MPSIKEVEYYLTGLWHLLRQDPGGFRYLDLSDRGALRSFWSIVYAAPSIAISWLWLRMSFLEAMPAGTEAGLLYFFRLALVETASWLIPLILAGLLAWGLGIGSRYSAIVSAVNWLALPVSYAYGVLIVLLMLVPALAGVVALLWFALMLAMIVAYFRVLRMICGDNLLTVATLTMVLLVPAMIFSDFLQRYLGVFPG